MRRRISRLWWCGAAALLATAIEARAQELPFGPGEKLTYLVRVDRMRASGRGTMWVEGPA